MDYMKHMIEGNTLEKKTDWGLTAFTLFLFTMLAGALMLGMLNHSDMRLQAAETTKLELRLDALATRIKDIDTKTTEMHDYTVNDRGMGASRDRDIYQLQQTLEKHNIPLVEVP